MAFNKYGGNKPKPNKGEDLKGLWHVTLKLDGARMHRDKEGDPISRAGKPLYNLDHIDKSIVDAEVYEGNWETSMSLVRSSVNGSPVDSSKVYSIEPLDPRMDLGEYTDPTHELLTKLMEQQIALGFEGLVVRQGDKWLKYKPSDTADVFVDGIQAGTGKHKGKMGALLTRYGKVGTGFSDEERTWWQLMFDLHGLVWLNKQLIQVSFMEWTKGGKFRHPAYEYIRDDKTEEHLGEMHEEMYTVRSN